MGLEENERRNGDGQTNENRNVKEVAIMSDK